MSVNVLRILLIAPSITLLLSLTNVKYDGIFITSPSGITEKFKYEKSYIEDSNSMLGKSFVTEYKIYTTDSFVHTHNILVANYKEKKFVMIVMEDIRRGYYDEVRRRSFSYIVEKPSLNTFGIKPKGFLLPYQVGVKFISNKYEHLNLVSFLVYEYGDGEDVYVSMIK